MKIDDIYLSDHDFFNPSSPKSSSVRPHASDYGISKYYQLWGNQISLSGIPLFLYPMHDLILVWKLST
ncbi:MAG: hypothetical protein JETT_2960 [Candidatus Jettenia ecosi]|uniref:Uncharacterized protein n=1 Tax=Candidatus Jettenia ecosi TaxID=2494326 RepID=A0A533Q969_9BACT|nr:MAG: hypothetical protein JETT_2960 [Candidatus Jettenia ecosi]